MSNAVVIWFKKNLGIIETKEKAIEPEVVAWAHNFLSGITPVIKEAATDGVLAAVSAPGNGVAKATAAFVAASADLAAKGIPFIENDLKAAIQIAYNALPASITGNTAAQAVETVVKGEVDKLGTEVAAKAPAA